MKIKKSITKKVSSAVSDCRKTLTNAIIDLCATIDRKQAGELFFSRPFMLSDSKIGRKELVFNTEQMVVNKIIYGDIDRMNGTFILSYNDTCVTSSIFMPLGDLLVTYEELKRTATNI